MLAIAARDRELFFVPALSFGSIVPEVRFGEPPLQRMRSNGQAFKPTREQRALPGLRRRTTFVARAELNPLRQRKLG